MNTDYGEFQAKILAYMLELSNMQSEVAPELFSPVADFFLAYFKQECELFKVQCDLRQARREAKYRKKLERSGWKRKVLEEYERFEESDPKRKLFGMKTTWYRQKVCDKPKAEVCSVDIGSQPDVIAPVRTNTAFEDL